MKTSNEEYLFNWNLLREEMRRVAVAHVTMVAELPQHPPSRLITGTTQGIEPIRKQRTSNVSHYSELLSDIQKVSQVGRRDYLTMVYPIEHPDLAELLSQSPPDKSKYY